MLYSLHQWRHWGGYHQGSNWGYHPYFFLKNWWPFLVFTVCQFCDVTPIFSPEKTDDLFLLITVIFIHFTRVSPPLEGVTPHLLPVRPRLCTILCKFAHKLFSFGCHPPWRVSPRTFYLSDLVCPLFFGVTPWRVSPGAVCPLPSLLVTPLVCTWL